MEALSPSQIETLLADRLKRHEERLREHRAALAGQKLWLERNKSQQSDASSAAHHGKEVVVEVPDERFSLAFHPSQVLPPAINNMPTTTSSAVNANNSNNNNNNNAVNVHSAPSSASPSQMFSASQPQQQSASADPQADAGSLASRQQQQRQQQRGASPRSSFPATKQSATKRGDNKSSRSTSREPHQQPAAASHHHHQQHRVEVLSAALHDRSERVSKMMLKFGPETGDSVGADILSGGSIMDVAAAETAACTFAPAISSDSRVLAKKLRAACGAQGKSVVEAMDAIHTRAQQQKWLRMQQIHEEQTRPYHLQPRSGRPQQQQQQQRTPARAGATAVTPRAVHSPRVQTHHSVASSGAVSATHLRLHEQATKHVKEERFRQIVSDATQENTFSPAITHRARALKRHPGHSVGDDLYGLALMKSNRDALAAQLRDEMEVATARQQGQPTIDAVSASIATALAESSYERLTKPAQQRRALSAAASSSSSRGSSADVAQPSFHPEINRRSEVLAHASSMQHSPNTVRQRRDERLRQLRDEVEQQRMEECTFKPSINPNSVKHQQQYGDVAASRDFFSRNEAWMKRRDTHIAQMRQEKQREELAECNFQPMQSAGLPSTGAAASQQPSHPSQQQAMIYGGQDRRAWGVDHHLDRMEAARIIDRDRRERAATGEPFHEPTSYQQQHQQQQQHQRHLRTAPQPRLPQPSYFVDPTDTHLGVFGGSRSGSNATAGGGEHNSVLARAQEALARAVAVSDQQQRNY